MVRGRIGGAPTPHMYRKTRGASPPGVWGGAAYRGRLRARATGNGPALQVSGIYSWGPNPRHVGVAGSSPPGVLVRSAVPRTPTSPLYSLRARPTGFGAVLLGPQPQTYEGGV
eukprot:gene25548-biopygen10520